MTANTMRLVDVVASELGEPAPETITADDVTAALEAAGYAWDGFEWNRLPISEPEATVSESVTVPVVD
jgi:hypothetical protein